MPEIEIASNIGHDLYRKVWDAARLRLGLEERWFEDTLQYLGKYDSETEEKLRAQKGSSRLFVNQTRPKVRTLTARLNDMLFPTDEANWDIQPTPVPRIDRALARRSAATPDNPLQAAETANADSEMDLAKHRALNMQRLMKDQLIESNYVDVGRLAIKQAVKLGAGVVKGPFGENRQKKQWKRGGDTSAWGLQRSADMRPKYSYVDLWNFYPDMDASSMEDCEHVFHMHRMSIQQLRRYAEMGVFDEKAARYLIERTPDYSPDDIGHFSQNLKYIRQLENETEDANLNRYIVFQYYGPLDGNQFESLCDYFEKPQLMEAFKAKLGGENGEYDPLKSVNGIVWFSADQVLAFDVNPLESGDLPFSVFRLDQTENTLIGSPGIPRMLRDPQASLNAAWRMAIESGGLAGVPMFVIDRNRISPVKGEGYEIRPRKVWLADTGFSTAEGGDPDPGHQHRRAARRPDLARDRIAAIHGRRVEPSDGGAGRAVRWREANRARHDPTGKRGEHAVPRLGALVRR